MKILGKLLTILVVGFGLWLLHSFVLDNAREPVVQTQIEHYIEAAGAAATIAYENDPEIRQQAMTKFVKINNGPMQVIGDDSVTWAMALFEVCMEDLNNEKCKERDLKTLSALLSKTMRASVAQSARLRVKNDN